jgi:hypothetical protein
MLPLLLLLLLLARAAAAACLALARSAKSASMSPATYFVQSNEVVILYDNDVYARPGVSDTFK